MTDQNAKLPVDPKILEDQKALEEFVDRLIKEKNSPYVNSSNIQTVKEGLLRDLSDAINRKLIEQLTDDKVEELNKLLESNASDAEVSKLFSDNIPNMQEILTQVFLDFRNGYLSVVYDKKTQLADSSELVPPPPPLPAPVAPMPVNSANSNALKKLN